MHDSRNEEPEAKEIINAKALQTPVTTSTENLKAMITEENMKYSEDWHAVTVPLAVTSTMSAQDNMTNMTKSATYNTCYLYSPSKYVSTIIVICVTGIINNFLCILVFWPNRNKFVTPVLLMQLAVVDSIILITWTVSLAYFAFAIHSDMPANHAQLALPYIAKYIWPMQNTAQMIGSWLTVNITVQRYVAVCHPHQMRCMDSVKVVWIQFAVLVSFSTLFISPRFFEFEASVRDGQVSVKPTKLRTNEKYNFYYTLVTYTVVVYALPFGFLVFFTASLIYQLKKSKATIESQIQAGTSTGTLTPGVSNPIKANKPQTGDVTFALIVVDIIFICCQLTTPLERLCHMLIPNDM